MRAIFETHPLLSRLIAFILLPAGVLVVATVWHFRQSLPSDGATLHGNVLHDVAIVRDAHGVVFIHAQTDADAFFALGVAHAQDRMWQLEVERRLVEGRLAEVLGRSALSGDIWMRTLGLYQAAKTSWPALSSAARDSLTQYARGINTWLASQPVLPPEFALLNVRPEPWSEIDSLAIQKLFAADLARNMSVEISNLTATRYYDRAQLCDLLRLCENIGAGLAASKSLHDIEDSLMIGGPWVGSNAWVISGRLMKHGSAVLANDSHMRLQIPSPWYVAHLEGDVLNVSGMTLVGLPVVIFGRNRDIVWGGTNMEADVEDLYFEQTDTRDASRYLRADQWEPFEVRREEIGVRADFPSALRPKPDPAIVQIRASRNGPIVSDALGLPQPAALKWTALAPGDRSYEAFLRANYAHDWTTFTESFRDFVAPALNLLYADRQGHIGSVGVGRIPVRGAGRGNLPMPGWQPEFEWRGVIPFEAMPRAYDPPSGYLISANDRNVAEDYPYFISDDWAPPWRAQRIRDMIEQRLTGGGRLELDDIARMQGDTLDLGADALLKFLRGVRVTNPQQRAAIAALARWNGDMSRYSVGATIFFAWAKNLREELFTNSFASGIDGKTREDLDAVAPTRTNEQTLRALTAPTSIWCSQTAGQRRVPCRDALLHALDGALEELRKLRGARQSAWQWGEVHPSVYAHMPFSNVESLAPFFERRIANGGSPDTINAASAEPVEAQGYLQKTGPSFRQIVSLGEGASHYRFINSTGQSGNCLSEHYDDMVQPLRDLQYYELELPAARAATSVFHVSPD